MPTITPTYHSIAWGPESWQRFDILAHPIRDGIDKTDPLRSGNPCLVFMHGGGHLGGSYMGIWLSNGVVMPFNKLLTYINDPRREVHFDIVSMESGQQRHTNDDAGGGQTATVDFSASKKMGFLEGVRDAKRGIAAIKAWGAGFNNTTGLRLNPTKFITGGQSAGATKAAIAAMTPPLDWGHTQSSNWRRINESGAFDSTGLGVMFLQGQIDFRNKIYGGSALDGGGVAVDYLRGTDQRGYFGTRSDDTGLEWNGIPGHMKDSISLVSYLEKGDTQYYVPMYNLQIEQGDHQLPLTNGHDSRQLADLNAALANARMPNGQMLRYESALCTGDDGSEISLAHATRIYGWMAALISQSTRAASKGAIR